MKPLSTWLKAFGFALIATAAIAAVEKAMQLNITSTDVSLLLVTLTMAQVIVDLQLDAKKAADEIRRNGGDDTADDGEQKHDGITPR